MTRLKKKLKAGMKARIWSRPITKEDYEGYAVLVRDETGSHGAIMDGYATWGVEFQDEPGRVLVRTFALEDVIA